MKQNKTKQNKTKQLHTLLQDILKNSLLIHSEKESNSSPAKNSHKLTKQSAARLKPFEEAKDLYSKALQSETTFDTVVDLIDSISKLFIRE